MSPQPLSRVRAGAEIRLDPWVMSDNPDLSLLAVGVISQWSYVELELFAIISTFLDADFEATYAMMAAITSDTARHAALERAADVCLSDDHAALLHNVMDRIAHPGKCRHKYAHRIWASSPDIDDALLLIDPPLLAQQYAERHAYRLEWDAWVEVVTSGDPERVASMPTGVVVRAPPTINEDLVEVYREPDLRRDLTAVNGALAKVRLLHFVLAGVDPDGKARNRLDRALRT